MAGDAVRGGAGGAGGGVKEAIFTGWVLQFLRPASQEPIWRWAERNVYLDEQMNPGRPGYYSSDLTPYTRGLQEFVQSDEADELIVEKSSQTGFTEACLNVVRWKPENDPGPVLYAIDTMEEVKRISNVRLKPTLKRCAGEVLPDDELGTTRLALDSMEILLTGGGSSAAFRNKPIELGILDEVENHKLNLKVGAEGSTLDLMRSRFTTVPDAKLIALSKPKVRGGIINAECESGTLEKWWVPCPHCERFQVLEDVSGEEPGRQFPAQLRFGHLKDLAGGYMMERFLREVYWECLYCRGEIYWHEHQAGMNARGEWRRTVVTETEYEALPADERVFYRLGRPATRKRSQRISDLNSPFERVSWGRLAQMFVDAVESKVVGKLEHLFTNHLTIAWEPTATRLTDAKLLALRSGLTNPKTGTPRGPRYFLSAMEERVCPVQQPVFVSVCWDRQDLCDKRTVVAWDEGLCGWLFDLGESVGDEAVLNVFGREYPVLGSDEVVMPLVGLIDAGFRTFETYDLCWRAQEMGLRLFPSMGAPGVEGFVAARRKKYGAREVWRFDYNDHNLKKLLYETWLDAGQEQRFWLPTDVRGFPAFLQELQAERLVQRRNEHGYTKVEWKLAGPANDYGDTMKMHLVCLKNMYQAAKEEIERRARERASA